MKQSFFDYNLQPSLAIDNYFVGKSNINAFNLLNNDVPTKNNFFLFGPNKSGKTHLGFIWKNKNKALIYTNNFDEIINNKKNVLIDNLFEKIDEENIFHIINHCTLNSLNILITSHIELNNYKFKINDLSSRLKIFHNIKIDMPDDELLINLMIKLFQDKQIVVKNHEIFNYIIKRVDRSYEKIFLLIMEIDKLLLTENKQLTIPLIKELI